MGRALLVANQYMLDFGIEQGVVCRQDSAARVAEDDIDFFIEFSTFSRSSK
jgi:hypothetical protein